MEVFDFPSWTSETSSQEKKRLFTLLILLDMDKKQSQANKYPNPCFNALPEISRKSCKLIISVLISPVELSLFAVTTAATYFLFISLHAL